MGKNAQQKTHKQKTKKTHRLYAMFILLLTTAAVILGILVLFYAQKVKVNGNDYCDTQEIKDTVLGGPYEINTLYILAKYKLGRGNELACMERMTVSLQNPWTLKVDVKEKKIVGYVEDGDQYAYFDKEGLVVKVSGELTEGLPSIEGIEVKNIKLYKKLKSDDTRIFKEILATSRDVTKYELTPDRIVCEDDEICLYFGDIRVSLGNSVSSEQIAQIAPILEKLTGQKGTLHLENYSSAKKTITFEKQKEDDEETDSDAVDDDAELYTWDGTDMNLYDDTYDETYDYSDIYTDDTYIYDDTYTYGDSYLYDDTYNDNGWYDDGTEWY